ncbi:MAG: portal protein [Nitrospiria bacterium]
MALRKRKPLKNPSIDSPSVKTYQPTVQDGALITMVNERYDIAHKNQYPYWIDFDRYYKMYESYINENKEIYQTKIFIPMVFSVIERFLPRIISSKPTVNFMPRRPDTVEKAQNMQSLFEWQWDQVSRRKGGGMYLEMLRFVKEALISGSAIAKVPWIKEEREVKKYDNENNVVNRIVKYFDGPDFELIDPYDFFYDPEAYDLQRASWVIHRTRKTLDEMKSVNKSKGVEIYKNLNILEQMKPDNLSATENDFKYRRKVALGGGQVLVLDDTTDKYELMECWGMFPKFDKNGKIPDSQDLEARVVVLANRSVIVRDIPYPYWHGKKPFIKYTPFPRQWEFYGIPIIKHLERIQFYMNEFVSQKFDNQVIELNQMLVIDPQANVEDWQLVWRPGGVIRAHPEYIKPLPIGDVTGPIDNSLAYLSQVAQLTTGLNDYYTSGTNAKDTQNKTATGANDIEEQIAARVQEAVQVLEEQVIKEIGYQWHGLDGQFVKLPLIVRVIGPDGKPDFPLIMPEDIRYDFDVIPESGSTQPTNLALQRQQFIQVLGLIGGNPVMAQNTDWQQVEKKLWEKFGEKDGNKLMTSTPGSTPQQMQGGQQLPGGAQAPQGAQQGPQVPQGMQMPAQMSGQMLGQAMQVGQQAQSPQATPQQGQQAPGGQAPMPGGPIKVSIVPKFTELTLKEQEQVLRQHGINPDMASRMEQFAKQQDQAKLDRANEIVQSPIAQLPQ